MMRTIKAVFGIGLAALFVFGLGVFSACSNSTDDEDDRIDEGGGYKNLSLNPFHKAQQY